MSTSAVGYNIASLVPWWHQAMIFLDGWDIRTRSTVCRFLIAVLNYLERRQSHLLLGDTQQKDEKQQAKLATKDISVIYKETFFNMEVVKCCSRGLERFCVISVLAGSQNWAGEDGATW